ncbi:hypothetical protein PAPYR_4728 [Paratrimastix pyriformis]|uniref:Uncharacterized protein n=1 Tax=Paratrimastix pyriformis TaxID=342808 RepID=A0ABQ8UJ03_9EUKA|nr:hypothetical protein PAPYR_4728 [Paratrimastix pyriformis]
MGRGYQAINWSPRRRTPHQERPLPDPYRPEAPTALTARPTTPASGAVEHKDRELEPLGQSWTTMMCRARPSPEGGPGGRQAKKDRGPREARRRPRWPPSQKAAKEARPRPSPTTGPPKPGPPHEAKGCGGEGSDDAPGRQAAAPAQAPGPSGISSSSSDEGVFAPGKAKAERKPEPPQHYSHYLPEHGPADRLSFTSTMIPEFGGNFFGYLVASEAHPVDQVASAHQFEHSTQARYYHDIDGDPRSTRPVASVTVLLRATIRPVSKVTEHCQTASRKSDRTLHRPLSCPLQRRWWSRPPRRLPCRRGLSAGSGVEGQGGSKPRDRTGRGAGTWMVDRQQHAPMFVFRTVPDGTWDADANAQKSQCKGNCVPFGSIFSLVPSSPFCLSSPRPRPRPRRGAAWEAPESCYLLRRNGVASVANMYDTRPGRPTRTTSPRRPLAKYCTIVEWFEKLGAAVLFSIIVQTSALDEARYQVVDGSHRFQVARIIVDPRRGGEAQQATPQIRQHLKEDYIDVAVYNTLDPEAMLELQHRVNLLTHDARFGSSTFDVLLNLKRASLQVCRLPSLDYHHPTSPPLSGPKRYIREDPDFATFGTRPQGLHFPKGEDAPAKLVKILECFSWRCCVPSPSSRLSDSRQPRTCGASLKGCGDESVACSRHVGGSFSGSEATSTAAADLKKPIRQAEQTFMLLEAHDAAEVAAGDHPRPLPAPDGAAREILRCHLVRTETFAFMNCLNVRPFPFRKGKFDSRPSPRSWEITFMDGRRLSEFELVLGYWLGWCAAQLPPAMQDYLMPEHCPYARLWEMGHHDIPVPASAC